MAEILPFQAVPQPLPADCEPWDEREFVPAEEHEIEAFHSAAPASPEYGECLVITLGVLLFWALLAYGLWQAVRGIFGL